MALTRQKLPWPDKPRRQKTELFGTRQTWDCGAMRVTRHVGGMGVYVPWAFHRMLDTLGDEDSRSMVYFWQPIDDGHRTLKAAQRAAEAHVRKFYERQARSRTKAAQEICESHAAARKEVT